MEIECKDEECGYNTNGECRFPELPRWCWRTVKADDIKAGDIILRFHPDKNEFEVIFTDSDHKTHSNFRKTLDYAMLDIFELLKMMA